MTNNTRSPDEIERDIERERAGLSNTLDDLQERFSIEGVARQLSDQFRDHGGEIGRSVSEAVKRNPVALAVTGAGLAWLMFGGNSRSGDNYDRRDTDYDRPRADTSYRSRERAVQSDPYAQRVTRSAHDGLHESARRQSVPTWARGTTEDDHDSITDRARAAASRASDSVQSAATHTSDGVTGAASSASHGVSSAAASVADTARGVGSSVASGARSARDTAASAGQSVADGVRHTASSTADSASALRDRLSEGTEALSEQARERVIAARARAVDAWHATERYSKQGRERAADMFEEHPLVAGALALAVGAAIGASLPRSRTEDAYFGEQSDALFEEAEHIYAEEKAKLGKVAQAAADEAKDIASEAKADADDKAPAENAAQAVADKAKESGRRVADAAKSEADKQELGKTKG